MDLFVVLILFVVCMGVSLTFGLSMLWPLLFGLIAFTVLSVRRRYTVKDVIGFIKGSLGDSFIVIRIMLLIGCLTGLWRQSGTIAYFITLGVSHIPPSAFLVAAFLLASVMSFALGTSFGVSATAGVILISVARAGGVNPILAAGAILSGIYVGDRGSPAASSANLVAVLTHTDMRKNVRAMLKCSIVPYLLCCLIFGILSLFTPMQSLTGEILDTLGSEFHLVWFCLIPAVLMIVLPFCGLHVKWSMVISMLSSLLVSLFVQHETFLSCLRAMIFGYTAKNEALTEMLSGGGILSMLEVSGILLISGTYGGIFRGTGMLSAVNEKLKKASEKIGRFPVMILLGFGVSALFCNQTIGAIMQSQLSEKLYGDSEEERYEKMLDMENSVILVAGLVPWCIACSVPLGMLAVDARAVLCNFYLWIVPIWWLIVSSIRKKKKGR